MNRIFDGYNGQHRNGHANGKATLPFADLRLPPQNLDAERQLLGAILLDNHALLDVVPLLNAEDFYRDNHQTIYRVIRELVDTGKPIDLVILREELSRRDELAQVGGTETLIEISNAAPHAANAAYHAHIVRDKAILRRLIGAATGTLDDAYACQLTVEEITDRAEQAVFAAGDAMVSHRSCPVGEVVDGAMTRIADRKRGEVAGIPTGFHDLDDILGGGFQDRELVIVAARPSMGKTSLAIGICEHAVVEAGVPCLFVSLEMGQGEIGERLLASRARVDLFKLRAAWGLSHAELDRLGIACAQLRDRPLAINDAPALTMGQLAAIARREKAARRIGLVVVDYLQLIEGSGDGDRGLSRQEVVSKISRRLKALAKELSLPVVALSQLNRMAEGRESSGHRPRLSDLRESGAIEQDADVVLLIHRPEYYDPNDRPGTAEVIVAKNRNGATETVNLTWLKTLARFESQARVIEPIDNQGYF